MKALVFIVCSVVIGWCGNASACATIYYIPFDVELYMPESEVSIEGRAFYTQHIDAGRFINKLVDKDLSKSYDDKNIRAKIEDEGRIYYIDRYGLVKYGEKFSYFDPALLDDMLATACTTK